MNRMAKFHDDIVTKSNVFRPYPEGYLLSSHIIPQYQTYSTETKLSNEKIHLKRVASRRPLLATDGEKETPFPHSFAAL